MIGHSSTSLVLHTLHSSYFYKCPSFLYVRIKHCLIQTIIRQTLKAVLEYPSWRFWRALRPTNSPWGLPLRRRRHPHPVGFGPWPWPLRGGVKLGPTVGGVYRGSLPFNCLPLPWGHLCIKCPPLLQPQHTGVADRRHPSATLGVSQLSIAGVAA